MKDATSKPARNALHFSSLPTRKLLRTALLGCLLAGSMSQAGAITLGELVRQAAFNNPAAVARKFAAEAAAEGVSSAKWQFFPTPSVSVERAGSRGANDLSYHGDSSVVVMRLQQTLWSGACYALPRIFISPSMCRRMTSAVAASSRRCAASWPAAASAPARSGWR